MRFYSKQHLHACGVDLHGRNLYLCILDQQGDIREFTSLRFATSADSVPCPTPSPVSTFLSGRRRPTDT